MGACGHGFFIINLIFSFQVSLKYLDNFLCVKACLLAKCVQRAGCCQNDLKTMNTTDSPHILL